MECIAQRSALPRGQLRFHSHLVGQSWPCVHTQPQGGQGRHCWLWVGSSGSTREALLRGQGGREAGFKLCSCGPLYVDLAGPRGAQTSS